MPNKTILDIPECEQVEMLKDVRAARYGYLLGLHILLLCARGKTPTEIADFLFCSRSSVYRTVQAYKCGEYRPTNHEAEAFQVLKFPARSWKQRLLTLLQKTPQAFGWCRTRWSCLTLAYQLRDERGITLSRETLRRALHEVGYAYKRARPVALDNDPERVQKLARIRTIAEHLRASEALYFADELDISLLPKIGYEWMKVGTQKEVMTPGKNEKAYLAGAWDYVTGKVLSVVGEKKNRWLFIRLLDEINQKCPATRISKIYVVADNYKIHKAKAVETWLANHPRFELVWLPTYCPKGNPIERIFGDIHDKCTRNHRRKRLVDVVGDCLRYLKRRGLWDYRLADIYYSEDVSAAVKGMKKGRVLQAA